ncbi:MAG: ComEC/Rec2 family competence protein [Patescibacteria group bacterium]
MIRLYVRAAILLFLILSNVLIWYAVSAEEGDTLKVSFLDVGQGDAIFIEAPNGNQMLIDGGKGKVVLEELAKVMPSYDRSIDIVLATHPDADHIGGLPEVLNRFDVSLFLEPGVSSDSAIYQGLEEIVKEKGIKKILARRGMNINLGGGVTFIVLFPDRDVSQFETNTASIVGKLVYGDSSFLLTGDSPKKIEQYLILLDKKGLDSDVLKAGHHGSRTSSDEFFVQAVSPEYTIISAGKNNQYGHPHKEVLDILKRFGTVILNTYETGTITFEVTESGLVLK